MLRITGGTWGGRQIETLPGGATRPSMDAHRLNLMNVLGQDLRGERVLDLFAGSGAFSIECLSRGAARAVLVEAARPALGVIHRNLNALAPPPGAAEVVTTDCYNLPPLDGPFDLIFVAPPYDHFRDEKERLERLVVSLAAGPEPLLAPDGLVIVQSNAGDFTGTGLTGLEVAKQKRWGRTEFTLLRHAASAPDAPPDAPPAPDA
jgi:16S rRNA (guanine966-N2)-methyltransferase